MAKKQRHHIKPVDELYLSSIVCIHSNRVDYRSTIESLIQQDNVDIEIILAYANEYIEPEEELDDAEEKFEFDDSQLDVRAVCQEYKTQYPNIKLVECDSCCVGAMRNKALPFATGKYVNFITAGAAFRLEKLLDLQNAMIENPDVNMFTVNTVTNRHKQLYKYTTLKMLDVFSIEEAPSKFVHDIGSCFFNRNVFDTIHFVEDKPEEEDMYFIYDYHHHYDTFYFCRPATYYCAVDYRQTPKYSQELMLSTLDFVDKIVQQPSPTPFEIAFAMYRLSVVIKNVRGAAFETEEEYAACIERLANALKYISEEDITNEAMLEVSSDFTYRIIMLKLKDNSLANDSARTFIANNMVVKMQDYSLEGNILSVLMLYSDYECEGIRLCAVDQDGKLIESDPTQEDYDSELYYHSYGDFPLGKRHFVRFNIDVTKVRKFNFATVNNYTGESIIVSKRVINNRLPVSASIKKIHIGDYVFYYRRAHFHIRKPRKLKGSFGLFVDRMLDIAKLTVRYKKLPVYRFFNKNEKKYILINDRRDKGGDNGEALFKGINKSYEDLRKITYFVIDKESADFKRLKQYGNVVAFGSLKHRILFLNAKYVYSSHIRPNIFCPYNYNKELKFYKDLMDYKLVWLQHGITMNGITVDYYSKRISNIISATNDEFKELSSTKYLYAPGQVVLTGFARYDYLINNPENIITIAPTWRRGFGVSGEVDVDWFKESEYYQRFARLLTNEQIIARARQDGYRIDFVLHPEMLNYSDCFNDLQNDVVRIIQPSEVNYSKIFEKTKLFITDYSSTLFDFAYLKKPEILYQFDKEEFFGGHYKKGYFNYETDAFGDVITSEEEMVNKILFFFDRNFENEQKYIDIINNTFKYTDQNNCKRIMQATYFNEE